MNLPRLQPRTRAFIAVIALLLLVFIYVVARSGPWAPVEVTVSTVVSQPISPSLFGVGTVQARYSHKVGPTVAGRVKRLDVQVGEVVRAGQLLGEMDPIDLDDRIRAQQAAIQAADAALRQAQARQRYAQTQAKRYEALMAVRATSEEIVITKQQDLALADAALAATHEDVVRMRAELGALRALRGNLRLVAPTAGLVAAREAEPGSTLLAGQTMVEIIDPNTLWVDTRFDQISADGLAAGLPARLTLRSRQGQSLPGRVLRLEPRADPVTEETLAKVVFNTAPVPRPPLGELVEVTVQLAALPAVPTIPNAALRSVDGQRGVWKLAADGLVFVPLQLGRVSLDGSVAVLKGLAAGDRVIVYSEKPLATHSRIHIVDHLKGVSP